MNVSRRACRTRTGLRLRTMAVAILAVGALLAPIAGTATPAAAADPAVAGIYAYSSGAGIVSGDTWEYNIDISCSGGNCDDGEIFIPFDLGLHSTWAYEAVIYDGNAVSSSGVTTKDGVEGYSITLADPLAQGYLGLLLRVTPTRGFVPNGHVWGFSPSFSFTSEGVPATVHAEDAWGGGVWDWTWTESSLSASMNPGFAVGLEPQTEGAIHENTARVAPGDPLYLRWSTQQELGTLYNDVSKPVTVAFTVPAGITYMPDRSDTDGVVYDSATRAMTITRTVDPAVSTYYSEWGRVVFRVDDDATGTILANPVVLSMTGIGATTPVTRTANTRVTVAAFSLSRNLFGLTPAGNLVVSRMTPSEPERTDSGLTGTESITRRSAYYSVSSYMDNSTDYWSKFTWVVPCSDDPLAPTPQRPVGGYTSPPSADAYCQGETVLKPRAIQVHGPAETGASIDYVLHLRDGSTQTLTVTVETGEHDDSLRVAIPDGLDVVAISADYFVPSRTTSADKTVTLVDTEILLGAPDRAGLQHGTEIESLTHFQGKTIETDPWINVTRRVASLVLWDGEPSVEMAGHDLSLPLSAGGTTANPLNAVVSRSHLVMGDAQAEAQNARTVFLFPATSTGIRLVDPMSTPDVQDLLADYGGAVTYFADYRGTGRQAWEVTGPATVGLHRGMYQLFTVQGAQAGVYRYDVYTGLDGRANPGECFTLPERDPDRWEGYNGESADLVAPSFWPVAGTGTCHVSGSITLTGSTSGFRLTKEIRENPNELFDAPDAPISTDDGALQYRLTFANIGPSSLDRVVMYDLLPSPGDTGTVGELLKRERGSTARAVLTEPVTAPAGYSVAYSTAEVPCRPEANAAISGCVDDWSTALPADLPAVTAIRIASDAGTTLVSGAVEQVTVEAAIPAESAPGSLAWNSMSGVAGTVGSPSMLQAAETGSVGARFGTEIAPQEPVQEPGREPDPESGIPVTGSDALWFLLGIGVVLLMAGGATVAIRLRRVRTR